MGDVFYILAETGEGAQAVAAYDTIAEQWQRYELDMSPVYFARVQKFSAAGGALWILLRESFGPEDTDPYQDKYYWLLHYDLETGEQSCNKLEFWQEGEPYLLALIALDGERALLGDGAQYGLKITFAEQPVARGIADALLIGREFVGEDRVCLVLGDNIFYAPSLGETLKAAAANCSGATVFGYWVEDPRPFGVVEFDQSGRAISIEEKPQNPKSNFIVPGLYFYDNRVVEFARRLTPSARGELEITSVNNVYLERGELSVIPLDPDTVWFDAGNADSLLHAGCAIREIQQKSGRAVACPEQIAFEQGWIGREQLRAIGESLRMTRYGQYLLSL